MIKAIKTKRGYGPILICDACGKNLDRLCIIIFDMEKYGKQEEGKIISVRTICRPCDQKNSHEGAWQEGRFFFDNLIHNTDLRLTKEDKKTQKLLKQL